MPFVPPRCTYWAWYQFHEPVVVMHHPLKDYAAAKGSLQIAKEATEIASGLNDQRPKLGKLLADGSIGTIVVENRDRLTRSVRTI